ncbi:tektin-4 [Plutella xylostella]|uniref:tektin-4 n=1 Tax=Plutella xylostella TaxID=51655 RepID=UPI002032789D|nr:tektin-4 [Plutella xylostella]
MVTEADMAEIRRHLCPVICPTNKVDAPDKTYLQAGQLPENKQEYGPYVPGLIKPPVKKVYPPGAPPEYLPQPTDTTSGDFLTMGPIGPWASGHIDWTPQAGSTGVRPIVDGYSITRYSTGQWRENNLKILAPKHIDKARETKVKIQGDLDNAFAIIDSANDNSNKMLTKRIKDLIEAEKAAKKAVEDITEEIEILDKDRATLKGACKILMLPEAISKECLDLRTQRLEPDLVRDDAEQELITEVSLVGEIRRIFMETLNKVEEQMKYNRAAKALMESDWSDKISTVKVDKKNLSMMRDSTLLLFHPGVDRWTENSCPLEYWLHFCEESIRNCEEVRKKSENLRQDLMTAIVKGGQDLRTQADRTDAALAHTVEVTEAMCRKLEETLVQTLKETADMETFIDHLKESLRKVDASFKNVMTRLNSRNYSRPNVENCRDEAQYALMKECKDLREARESLKTQLRDAEAARAALMKYRGDLEKDIASKRKSLLIDGDRCVRARQWFPKPEEFASG